jgi:bifunctional enzyme CysN/CysC
MTVKTALAEHEHKNSDLPHSEIPETGTTHPIHEARDIHGDQDINPDQPPALPIKVLTCGSVDDGKSTLIGRLLWDATILPEDQKQSIEKSEIKIAGGQKVFDYSRLVDGLMAEREQGITIDIAFRYADLPTRRLVFIDAPGHEQYTRNMVTGASQADMAMILIDARNGVTEQTRRHAAICRLAGIHHLIVVINKIDLVNWDQSCFDKIAYDMRSVLHSLHFHNVSIIPGSALLGDNVTIRSKHMPWYEGRTVLDEIIWANPAKADMGDAAFRFPVQYVIRDGQDFRGLAGTVTSGSISVGDPIQDASSGVSSTISRIVTMNGDLDIAYSGQAVVLVLAHDRDIARGDVLIKGDDRLDGVTQLKAQLVWLHEKPFDGKALPLIRSLTDTASLLSLKINSRTDLNTFEQTYTESLGMNDLVNASLSLSRPMTLEISENEAPLSRFILVDPLDGTTLAAGIIDSVITKNEQNAHENSEGESPQNYYHKVHFTRQDLAAEVFSDLNDEDAHREEFDRRAKALKKLLEKQGVDVFLSLDSSEL